ncbi:hypothetical protein [Cohnella sp.]|uniref:hypothetical protein n=1 Tax=Cohnella sp. TaxID=1883426 RepID=UPI003565F586
MNIKQMIVQNNERRKLLEPHNLAAYEDALVYIRLNGRSEHSTESILLELLEHLIEAQRHGKTAKDVFGDDLRAYCDSLVAAIPHQSKLSWVFDILRYISILLGSLFAVHTVFQLLADFFPTLRVEQISLVPHLVIIGLGAIEIFVLLVAMRAFVFGRNSGFILAGVTNLAAIAVYVIATVLFRDVWAVPVHFWSFLAVTLLMFGMAHLFKRISGRMNQTTASF